MNFLLKKFNSFFIKFQKYLKKRLGIHKQDLRDYTGKRKIDQFRRFIIKFRKTNDIITYTLQFLKDTLKTDTVGFYYWNEEIGHFVDFHKQDQNPKYQIFDPLLIIMSEYDIIFLKRNLEVLRNPEHIEILQQFMKKQNCNVIIPLILNETILGFIYAKTDLYISISEYFILEELRYFVIVSLSNSLIYQRLENLLKNLEIEVEKRTEELKRAQQTILQQEKMATLGVMVAGVAHELNTPTSVILSSVQNIYKNSEEVIESFFLNKRMQNLTDEFFSILHYFIYHISIYSSYSQTRTFKLKKSLKEYLESQGLPYDEDLIQFLIDFHFFTGSFDVFQNNDSLLNKIIEFYSHSQPTERKELLKILKSMALIFDNLRRIHEASKSIQKIVQSLRSYSRSSKNEFLKCSPITIIENAIEMTQSTIKDRIPIEKVYEYHNEIFCDPNQIQQVLINLILNAYQAITDANILNPKIQILLKELSEKMIEIQVIDNGPGIPKEIQDQVWDPFFTTKPQGKGTGLGLSIVKNIVENHNGKVFFESDSSGTKFFIHLPKEQMSPPKQKIHPSIKFGRYDWR